MGWAGGLVSWGMKEGLGRVGVALALRGNVLKGTPMSPCAQVPTFRSDPLTPQCDEWCAFQQGPALRLRYSRPGILCCLLPASVAWEASPQCCWAIAPCRCEYPVSDRPNAVRQFFDAVKRNASLVKVGSPQLAFGAWPRIAGQCAAALSPGRLLRWGHACSWQGPSLGLLRLDRNSISLNQSQKGPD